MRYVALSVVVLAGFRMWMYSEERGVMAQVNNTLTAALAVLGLLLFAFSL